MSRLREYLASEASEFTVRLMILVVTVAVVTTVMTFFVTDYLEPNAYQEGRVARHTVIARREFKLEDSKATERKRAIARSNIPRIYLIRESVRNTINSRLQSIFAGVDELSKKYSQTTERGSEELPIQELNEEFGVDLSTADWEYLLDANNRSAIKQEVARFAPAILRRGIINGLSDHHSSAGQRRIILRSAASGKEELLSSQDRLLDEDTAYSEFVSRLPQKGFRKGTHFDRLVIELGRLVLRSNVEFLEDETLEAEKSASAAVEPEYLSVRRGEVIVRSGSVITKAEHLKLQAMLTIQGKTNFTQTWASYCILGTIILLCVFFFVERYWPYFRASNRDLSVTALTLCGSILLLKLFFGLSNSLSYTFFDFDTRAFLLLSPLAAGGMLLQTILGPASVLLFVLSFALLVGVFLTDSWLVVSLIVIGNIVGAICLKSCRRRSSFLVAGGRVAVANIVLVACLALLSPEIGRTEVAIEVLCVLFGGILSGLLALGLTPVAEIIGGYVSDFKLLELASLDRPLLSELSLQAPGTWNHSMVIGQMGESAAESIGANGLLTRVAAYYHDIGKVKKPLYFVENQSGKENRHDKLTPSMSALIIKSHVKDGVELARQHGVPQALIDFIYQHHGTSLIEYFYDKALKDADSEDGVDETHYRYPGPRPQSREAGILMLADIIEASSRTLADPSPAKIQGLVQKAINRVFASGELNESTLTLNDLNKIAKSFTRVLSGIYHRRIEYSESVEKTKEGKHKQHESSESSERSEEDKSGSGGPASEAGPDQKNGETSAKEESEGGSPETLKRLGLQ